MDVDFQACLEVNNGDAAMAFRDACLANLGYLVQEGAVEQVCNNFMFRDSEEDLQATSGEAPSK